MPDRPLSRRQFLGSAAVVGAAAVAPSAALGPSDPAPVRPLLPPVTLAPEVLPSGAARQFGSGRFRSFGMLWARFSADSRWVVEFNRGWCRVHELSTGKRFEFGTLFDADWEVGNWLSTTDGRLTVVEHREKKAFRVRRYDLLTGHPHPPIPLNGNGDYIVSANGRVAAQLKEGEGGLSGTELQTGNVVWAWEEAKPLQAFDPSGRFVLAGRCLVGSEELAEVRLLNVATGRMTRLEWPTGRNWLPARDAMCCSANGRRVTVEEVAKDAGWNRHRFITWDVTDGRMIGTFVSDQIERLFGSTADGSGVFTVDGPDLRLVVRDALSGKITRRYPVFDVDGSRSAVTPDGKTLLLGRRERGEKTPASNTDNEMLRLIDADTGATLPQSPDPPGPIVRVWFPTRDTTAAAFRTRVGHLDYVRWDTATGRGRRITDPTDRNEATRTIDLDPVPLASPDLEHFLRPDGLHLVVLHGPTGKAVARREQPSAANGRWFWLDPATVGIFALDGLHLWAWAADTSRLLPLVLPGKWPHVWRWRASADGRTLAVQFFPNLTGRACMVAWVDVPTGKITTTEFGENACGDWFGGSVDANRLAVQLSKEVFHVHDRAGWRGMFRVPNALPKCDLTACGRTLAVQRDDWTDDEGVRHPAAFELWEVATGQRRWSRPVDRAFDDLRASPSGRFVATCRADQPVYLWDVFGETSDPQSEPTDGQRVWDDLGSIDAEVAFRVVRQLVQHPLAAVRLLSAKLKPAEAPKRAWIDERIEQLGHRDFRTRQTAEKELTAHADLIADQLRAALEAGLDTEEAEERLQRIVGRATAPLDYVRLMRVVEVLEYAGEAGGPLLSRLANGAPGLLTREATAAIRRRDR